MEILDKSALDIGKMIKNKSISVKEVLNEVLQNIDEKEKKYNSFITLYDRDELEKKAEKIQKSIDSGESNSLLAGVPIAVKDNICTKDKLTTCGSKILSNFKPPYSAFAVDKLEAKEVLIIGKTNMDEFGMGSTTESSFYGITKNPHNENHVAGGSSGGSCAAVALGECFGALGSDTGGSIRQPSSYCGVVGIKPTYGTVSRNGLISYASSMDQIGTIGKSVADAVHILEAVSGYDKNDSTSLNRTDIDFSTALQTDIKGMRIGIPMDYLKETINEDIVNSVMDVAKIYQENGAIIEEFNLGMSEYAVVAYYILACAQASSNLARYDGVKYGFRANDSDNLHEMYKKTRSEGFGEEVKRRIMIGSYILSEGFYDKYYLKAMETMELIKNAYERAFEKYDVILMPVTPDMPPKVGQLSDKNIDMYKSDIFTVPVNLAGLPAISVPYKIGRDNLPIGIQLIGKKFGEKDIIRAAHSLENISNINT